MTTETDIATLATARDAGAVVVDVREPGEFVTGHVPGAVNIPLNLLADRLAEVPAGTPVYVVCASGNRSKVGADLLTRAGREAVSVAGGTSAWQRTGHAVTTGARA